MSTLAESLAGRPEDVAPRLLGALLHHGGVTVRVSEVEAYGGPDDPGSHAARGRTARTASMFEAPGTLYCYLSHGIHVCANVVVGAVGEPAAILVRAGEVVEGLEVARSRRPGSSHRDLARGPGRLGRVLALRTEDDGADLARGPVTLTLVPVPARDVASGPRVGLRCASERPWRFWVPGDRSVSAYRRHPAADGSHA